METLLHIALANVAVAALIAIAATAVGLVRGRPALAHALWVLVLLKLLTPPLWGVSFERLWEKVVPAALKVETHHPVPLSPDEMLSATEPQVGPSTGADEGAPWHDAAARQEEPLATLPANIIPPAPASLRWGRWLMTAGSLLWCTGSVVCAAVIALRVVRFHRLLRYATPAPPAQLTRSQALARRMGVARTPRLSFIPGAVCPMLWPLGRGLQLLIPRQLWDRLGQGQRSSLLAHELAHLRRRDHWVRLLEVLASIIYWWCPLIWYARRRLREAEEQCCDAWVVWAIPGSGRDYASALLETVEFVTSGGGNAGITPRPVTPMLACGMGQFHQLRRRLVMIKNAQVPRNLSLGGWAAVSALAVALLPLAPSRAQVPSAKPEPASEPVTAEVSVQPTPPVPTEAVAPAALPTPAVSAVAPVSDYSAVIEDLKAASKASQESAYKVKKAAASGGDDKLDAEREALRAEMRQLERQLERAKHQLAALEDAAAKNNWKKFPKSPAGSSQGNSAVTPGAAPAPKLPPAVEKPRDPHLQSFRFGETGQKMPNDPRSRERRLDEVEANLQRLIEEVRALRSESAAKRTTEPR